MEIIVCTFSRVKNTKGSSWGGGEHIYIYICIFLYIIVWGLSGIGINTKQEEVQSLVRKKMHFCQLGRTESLATLSGIGVGSSSGDTQNGRGKGRLLEGPRACYKKQFSAAEALQYHTCSRFIPIVPSFEEVTRLLDIARCFYTRNLARIRKTVLAAMANVSGAGYPSPSANYELGCRDSTAAGLLEIATHFVWKTTLLLWM